MAAIGNFTLNGVPFDTVREVKGWKLNAQFGLNPQPSINLSEVSFTNTNKSLTSDNLRLAHNSLPTEGAKLGFEVTDGVSNFPFSFILDYNTYKEVAPNETKCSLKLDKSIDSLLDLQGEDITMRLLVSKGIINPTHYVNHPYVVENRKTLLERMVVLGNVVLTYKALADEMFKIINIAADITSLGAIQAAINLAQTIANLVVLVNRLVNLITELQANFAPPIRYHSAIKLKTFLERAAFYLGYDIEFGTWLEDIVLLPSKYDEQGNLSSDTGFFQEGILKPTNFGYNLKQAFELAKKLFNTDLAIIDETIHCKPKNDPFWNSLSGYVMPNILIENSPFVDNGYKRFNREDLKAANILEYSTDDSDYWTIQEAANDSNGDRFCLSLNTPITVLNERDININGIEINTIPYALVVRKNLISDLIDSLISLNAQFESFITIIQNTYESVTDIIEESLPSFLSLPDFSFGRDGALKVENDFFSTPKISILELDGAGRNRIPSNFNDLIGAKALFRKYHNYDSLIQGVRNPDDLLDTNGKEIYESVEIPFNIEDVILLLNNSYFSTQDGRRGKFMSIEWDIERDMATCDFWIQSAWLTNMQQTLS